MTVPAALAAQDVSVLVGGVSARYADSVSGSAGIGVERRGVVVGAGGKAECQHGQDRGRTRQARTESRMHRGAPPRETGSLDLEVSRLPVNGAGPSRLREGEDGANGRQARQRIGKLEREKGFEPSTLTLAT